MATLRELKKRLKSTETTGQIAGAMRTVATAKYRKVSSLYSDFAPYSDALYELCSVAPPERDMEEEPFGPAEQNKKPPLFVLVSGNRGLCGGYHQELFTFFHNEIITKLPEAKIVVCGRMAEEYCREKRIGISASFAVSDVPDFEEALHISEYLAEKYRSKEVSLVAFVCQRFCNMLKQEPEIRRFLPLEAADGAENGETDVLFIPDRATVSRRLEPLLLSSTVYSVLLGCASGQQAATMMAMRSAYDNAEASARKLGTEINRRRQAEVTASVIETSADTGPF